MTFHQFIVEDDAPVRLDKFLVEQLVNVSRSRIQQLVKDGFTLVDGNQVTKNNLLLNRGQKVDIEVLEIETEQLLPSNLDIEVIYCDKDTIVLNKPSGVVVHPGAGKETESIASFALFNWPEIAQVGQKGRPGIVHRLDKDTSGVILLARTQFAYDWYNQQFKSRQLEKIYLALVDGHPPTPEGRIDAPIIRDEKRRKRMAIAPRGRGRKAVSEYFQAEWFEDHELLRIRMETGRTHQIRVHMAFLGTPVVGDKIYGKKKPSIPIKRFFLHASELQVCLPGSETVMTFKAELPNELSEVLRILRNEPGVG